MNSQQHRHSRTSKICYSWLLYAVYDHITFCFDKPQLLLVSNYELTLTFFVFGGLVVGFCFFIHITLSLDGLYMLLKKRRSVKKALKLLTKSDIDFDDVDDKTKKKALELQGKGSFKIDKRWR